MGWRVGRRQQQHVAKGRPEWFGGRRGLGGSDFDSGRGEAQAAEFDAIQTRKAEARAAAKKHKPRYHRLKKMRWSARSQSSESKGGCNTCAVLSLIRQRGFHAVNFCD